MLFTATKVIIFLQFYLASCNNVLQITTKISAIIKNNQYVFIMFYEPFCEFCQKTEQEFNKSAESITNQQITFLQVDCTKYYSCNSYKIIDYPTLMLFKNGKYYENYNGKRNYIEIVSYLTKTMEPSFIKLNNDEDKNRFINISSEVCIIGYFIGDSNLKNVFIKLSYILSNLAKFAYFNNRVEAKNKVQLIRPTYLKNTFENSELTYRGNGSDLKSFILRNIHGLVGHRKPHNADDFKTPAILIYYNVDYNNNPKGTNYWRNRIFKVAERFRNITFAFSSLDDFRNEIYLYEGNLNNPLVVAKTQSVKIILMSDKFSLENLNQFAREFSENKLGNGKYGGENNTVFIVNTRNFYVILDNQKDVFVLFYSPYCKCSAKILPLFDKLAEMLKYEDVLIAKMDAVANEVPNVFNFRGYPSLYLILHEARHDPIEYVGPRKLMDFIEYIAKYATNELQDFDRNGRSKNKRIEL